jgi:hypothetical protein
MQKLTSATGPRFPSSFRLVVPLRQEDDPRLLEERHELRCGELLLAPDGRRLTGLGLAAQAEPDSSPAGEKTSNSLTAWTDLFLNRWRVPRGTKTKSPVWAMNVRAPSSISSSPSRT